ncbi:MAG: hypothetical protein ABI351_04680, partial [Herbaspirillum sp.]
MHVTTNAINAPILTRVPKDTIIFRIIKAIWAYTGNTAATYHCANLKSVLTKTFIVTGILFGFTGCASYILKPLPERVDLPRSAASIVIDSANLPFHHLSSHVFNPADGLDMDEVAMLAVANNPQLKQARDALGIARAQSFAAGLLPDPQLGLTSDHPTNGTSSNT